MPVDHTAGQVQLAQTDCSLLDTMIECLDIKVHSLGIMALL